jgi:hypothetical protein
MSGAQIQFFEALKRNKIYSDNFTFKSNGQLSELMRGSSLEDLI